ncbi:unnamed protein product, partial [Prunus brigantina]
VAIAPPPLRPSPPSSPHLSLFFSHIFPSSYPILSSPSPPQIVCLSVFFVWLFLQCSR